MYGDWSGFRGGCLEKHPAKCVYAAMASGPHRGKNGGGAGSFRCAASGSGADVHGGSRPPCQRRVPCGCGSGGRGGKQRKLWLTNWENKRYNRDTIPQKGSEEKSSPAKADREPRKLKRGTREQGEHGLGADRSIGRPVRVRPSSREEVSLRDTKQGGTASILSPLSDSRAVFFFRRISYV